MLVVVMMGMVGMGSTPIKLYSSLYSWSKSWLSKLVGVSVNISEQSIITRQLG